MRTGSHDLLRCAICILEWRLKFEHLALPSDTDIRIAEWWIEDILCRSRNSWKSLDATKTNALTLWFYAGANSYCTGFNTITIHIKLVTSVCGIMIYWTNKRIFSRETFLESIWFGIDGNLLCFHPFLSNKLFTKKINVKYLTVLPQAEAKRS
jgi:hypothetical protein